MSAFVLKIIAIFSMTCDHLSYLIFGGFSFLNYIGRIAFPIFAYQITEGYIHTSNLKKYFFRLFMFALISQIPFMLFMSMYTSPLHLNVFFTLFIGLLAITVYEKLNKIQTKNNLSHIVYNALGILIAFMLSDFAIFICTDYGYFGVLIIFFFYLFRNKKILMNSSFIILVLIYYGKKLLFSPIYTTYLVLTIFTMLPLLFINLYNHKKGKDIKYILYLFYPLHFLIIYATNLILN